MKTDPISNVASASAPDRRRHARYRFSVPITVHSSGHQAVRGMSLEISESGMSAMIGDVLQVGDTVELEPVAGGRVSALVRRHSGKIYGFEFRNLTPAQSRRIVESCELLPLYDSKTLNI